MARCLLLPLLPHAVIVNCFFFFCSLSSFICHLHYFICPGMVWALQVAVCYFFSQFLFSFVFWLHSGRRCENCQHFWCQRQRLLATANLLLHALFPSSAAAWLLHVTIPLITHIACNCEYAQCMFVFSLVYLPFCLLVSVAATRLAVCCCLCIVCF